MNDTIENFLKALKKIDERDYITQRVQLIEDNVNVYNDVFSTYENNFVTKLNENYAVLMHQDEINEPKELIRQFQIPKKYAYSPISEDLIRDSFNKLSNIIDDNVDPIKEFTLIPDFIIHKDQEDKSEEHQRLIAEVKTEQNLTYKKFAYDFLKLIIYLNKFKFQNAIFLSVNIPADTISDYIKRYFKERMYLPENYSKLYIITKENYNTEHHTINLQDLFDSEMRNKG